MAAAVSAQQPAVCAWHGQRASQRRYAVCRSSQAVAATQDWFMQPQHEPYVGSVELKVIPGKGRGVVASQAIAAGEPIFLVPPVAIINSAPGHARMGGDELVDLVIEQGLWRRAWFESLTDGSSASCSQCPDIHMAHDALVQDTPALQGSPSAANSEDSGKGQGFAGSKSKSKIRRPSKKPLDTPAGLDKKAVRRIAQRTRLNCYGDDHEDLALCQLRGEPARGHIGIWGPFAMLNHSCAPNTINYVVGDSMCVRAARPIKAGEEVYISYLGRPQLWPVELRKAELKENYGFDCDCERCKLEEHHVEKLDPSQYDELYARVHSRMSEQFQDAVKQGDREELETLHGDLQASLHALTQQFRKALISPTARLYLMASLYEVLELMVSGESTRSTRNLIEAHQVDLCRELDLKEDRLLHMNHTLRCIESVTPGSDLHCIVSSQYYAANEEVHGAHAASTHHALQLARAAHMARYGPISEAAFDQLMVLNRTLYK